MSRKNILKFSFDVIFERIKASTDIENTVQLAEIIGVAQPTISNNKRRNVFPVEWAYILGKKYDLLTEWIMEGKGPKRFAREKDEEPKMNFLKEIECWLEEERKKEPDIEAWFRIEFREKFTKFDEWKRKAEIEQENNSIQMQKVV